MIDMTKLYKKRYKIATVLSILLNIGPFLAYTGIAYFSGTAFINKTCLSLTLILVGICTIYAISKKKLMKSNFWILLIGLWLCLDNILTILIVFASTQVIDELIVTPYAEYYQRKYERFKDNDEYWEHKGMS